MSIIKGIRWVGIIEYMKLCFYWHKIVTYNDIWEWKTGN